MTMLVQPQAQERSDLSRSFPAIPTQNNYAQNFLEIMHHNGISFKGEVIADGAFHRFAPNGKDKKSGWYVFYGMAGAFGDWSQDLHLKWHARDTTLSPKEKQALHQQLKDTQRAVEGERQTQYIKTAEIALEKWGAFSEIGNSPYLLKKQVNSYGARFSGDLLVIPLRDIRGKLWSLQWINIDGSKRFLRGGRKKGCFHVFGSLQDNKPIIVSEGYATGASIHMATDLCTVIAFDVGNLDPVIEELKKAYPKSAILIAGDDDTSKEQNIGREKAEGAAKKHQCSVIFPKFRHRDTNPTDFNDLHVLEGIQRVKYQIEKGLRKTTLKSVNLRDLLSLEIKPREMILGPIVPEQGLVMLHAPRGIGKTHVSLMIAYSAATGTSMFQNKWISAKPQRVLIVDGEMPLVAMQERLAKIVNSNTVEKFMDENLQIITPDLQEKGIPDLSTTEGQRLIEEHLNDVKLLILDNYSALCRGGRENEAESWIPLQEWFLNLRRRGISVLLIHHSNKSGGQRGTSRKEDLLDTIITLRKPEDYDPREGARFEVHYEKARGFYGEEAAPFEAWLKEYNEQAVWHIRPLEDCELDKVVQLKKEGLTQRDIALETGLSPATVNRRLKEAKEKGLLYV